MSLWIALWRCDNDLFFERKPRNMRIPQLLNVPLMTILSLHKLLRRGRRKEHTFSIVTPKTTLESSWVNITAHSGNWWLMSANYPHPSQFPTHFTFLEGSYQNIKVESPTPKTPRVFRGNGMRGRRDKGTFLPFYCRRATRLSPGEWATSKANTEKGEEGGAHLRRTNFN